VTARLSEKSLEDILIALAQARDENGNPVNIPPTWALSPDFLAQFPQPLAWPSAPARFG
jgi:hypothetical protein